MFDWIPLEGWQRLLFFSVILGLIARGILGGLNKADRREGQSKNLWLVREPGDSQTDDRVTYIINGLFILGGLISFPIMCLAALINANRLVGLLRKPKPVKR